MREKFEQIRTNWEAAQASSDPAALVRVVDDMGFILNEWSTPGVVMSAMSISRHARGIEREEVLAILEKMLQKLSAGELVTLQVEGADEQTNALMNSAVAGAMKGLLEGVISVIRKRGGHES